MSQSCRTMFRAELSDCRVEVGGLTMATESCLNLASSRDRPTSLTVGCLRSRSWSRNPGEEERQGRRVREGKTLILRQRREKRRTRRQEANEGWKNAVLAKMRLLRWGSLSFAESVTSSLPRRSRPSADIASGKTSSGETKNNAKNVLTLSARPQQPQRQHRRQPQQLHQHANLSQPLHPCGRNAETRLSGRRTRTRARRRWTSARIGCSGRPTLRSVRRTRVIEPGWQSVVKTKNSWRTTKISKSANLLTSRSRKTNPPWKSLTALRSW